MNLNCTGASTVSAGNNAIQPGPASGIDPGSDRLVALTCEKASIVPEWATGADHRPFGIAPLIGLYPCRGARDDLRDTIMIHIHQLDRIIVRLLVEALAVAQFATSIYLRPAF